MNAATFTDPVNQERRYALMESVLVIVEFKTHTNMRKKILLKFFLIMKFTFIFMFLTALHITANVRSQSAVISVNMNEARLGEIIRLIDGPTSPIACVSCTSYNYCDYESKCVLKPIWQQVREATNSIVDNITFADLAKKEQELIMGRQALTYII